MRILKALLRVVLPLLVVGAALALAFYLVRTRARPPQRARGEAVTLVPVTNVFPRSAVVRLTGMGTVTPARRVRVQPEVGGLVTWTHPDLEPGAVFSAGTEVARIDARNYEAILAQQRAALAQARLALELERSRKTVAEAEWKLLEPDPAVDEAARTLALREPQIEAARAALAAAGEAVARAALDVERTRIRVPFDSLVLSESVDVGQLVSAQHVIAELAGTQAYRIEAALPVADLAWLPPLDAAGTNGVPCRITQDMGNGARLERRGFVTHVLGDLDPAGRLARVLVEVPDPAGQDLPGRLLLGAYVNVRIDGRRLDGVFVLRERWIHEGGRVWIKGPDNRLEFRTVRVLRRQDGDAFVDQGLDAGVTVVTGRIPVPVPGMLLKSAGPARAAGAPE